MLTEAVSSIVATSTVAIFPRTANNVAGVKFSILPTEATSSFDGLRKVDFSEVLNVNNVVPLADIKFKVFMLILSGN
jgi:hypothetical protein